jgi:hypothetical protein
MKVISYIFMFMILISCSHKKIKGRRDIETPTSPGAKTNLTIRPESLGMGLIKNRRTKNANAQGSAGNKSSEGVTDNRSGR